MFWVHLLVFFLVMLLIIYLVLKPIRRELVIEIIRPPKFYDANNKVIEEKDIDRKRYIYMGYHNRIPVDGKIENVFVPEVGKGLEIENNRAKNKRKKVDEYKPKRVEK
jgi:hypothetical protein